MPSTCSAVCTSPRACLCPPAPLHRSPLGTHPTALASVARLGWGLVRCEWGCPELGRSVRPERYGPKQYRSTRVPTERCCRAQDTDRSPRKEARAARTERCPQATPTNKQTAKPESIKQRLGRFLPPAYQLSRPRRSPRPARCCLGAPDALAQHPACCPLPIRPVSAVMYHVRASR